MTEKQRPTRTYRENDATDDYIEEHPAYALIGASRVTSHPGTFLTGSDFRHGNYIVIRLQYAQLHRGLSYDRFQSTRRGQIVEVALSEAQWATFLSTLNMGEGVPATLVWMRDEGYLPSIEPITDRREQLRGEVDEHLQDALAAIREVIDAGVPKKVREAAERAERQLRANLPFIAKSFDEHAERTVEKAKVEVNAYVTNVIQRAGLEALGGHQPIALIEEGEVERE